MKRKIGLVEPLQDSNVGGHRDFKSYEVISESVKSHKMVKQYPLGERVLGSSGAAVWFGDSISNAVATKDSSLGDTLLLHDGSGDHCRSVAHTMDGTSVLLFS